MIKMKISLAGLFAKSAVELTGSTVQTIVRDWASDHGEDHDFDDEYVGERIANLELRRGDRDDPSSRPPVMGKFSLKPSYACDQRHWLYINHNLHVVF